MKLRTIQEADIRKGMKVLLRTDFDVAVKNGKVADEFRLKESLPSIRYILSRGACPIIISHRGRPAGKRRRALSMLPIAKRLERLMGKKVVFLRDPFSPKAREAPYPFGAVILFENIRFWKGEEENSASFAKRLARWGELYVNDAFASSHRKHASIVFLPRILPSFAGLHLAKEIRELSKILKDPERPLAAVIGGAKLETKIPLIKRFLSLGAEVMVGGAAANTLLERPWTRSVQVKGLSLFNEAREIVKKNNLYLPSDLRGGKTPSSPMTLINLNNQKEIQFHKFIPYDVGPSTVRRFSSLLRCAKTIVWNGPLGLIEVPKYAKGTLALARNIRRIRAFKVVGGGDTIAILRKHKLLNGFDHVSTGGGAMLEFLAGKKLPGIEALRR